MGIKQRKKREKERRRQQIMVAAKRVFAEKGFTRTTIEDIAREAELSPGTLYLYFKNKDELYASLSLRILKYLQIRLEDLHITKGLSPEQRVGLLKELLYDVYEFDPTILINMFHLQSGDTMKNLSPELLSEIKTMSDQALSILSKIFEDVDQKGAFVDKNPLVLANILWALFAGIVLWEESKQTVSEKSSSNLKQTLETAFDIFHRGILKIERNENNT